MSQRSVLIAGSEGALGKALTEEFKSRGYKVVGIDRHSQPLSSCHSYYTIDFLDRAWSKKLEPLGDSKLDHIVWTIGDGWVGDFRDQDPKKIEELYQINFVIPCLFAKKMISYLNPGGSLNFVGSVTSFLPSPNYVIYASSKRALHSFVRSFRWECPRIKIKIFHPGAFRSSFHTRVGFYPSKKQLSRFLDPKSVAVKLVKGLESKGWLGFDSLLSRLVYYLDRFFPNLLVKVLKWKWDQS